jgi:collagen triple helix repeat protein
MRRRLPSLLAVPAVIAAMAVAVPALAGISSGGGAHESTAPKAHKAAAPKAHTSANCIIALVGKRHVRECLVAGPKGPRGVRGFLGPNGPRGVQGKTGKQGATGEAGATGSQGPQGTARAYALVQPQAVSQSGLSGAGLVPGQTVGIAAIRRVPPGIYCLLPASGINPTAEAPVASGEASQSSSKVGVPLAVVYAGLPNNCGSGELEVKTYNIPTPTSTSTSPELSNEVAFTIIVP